MDVKDTEIIQKKMDLILALENKMEEIFKSYENIKTLMPVEEKNCEGTGDKEWEVSLIAAIREIYTNLINNENEVKKMLYNSCRFNSLEHVDRLYLIKGSICPYYDKLYL